MKHLNKILFVVPLIFLLTTFASAQDQNIVTNQGEITINTKSKNVWKVLTNSKKYAKVIGYKWKSGKKDVGQAGDQAIMYLLEQQTNYEVTFIEPGEKITVKLVPSTAEYVNEKTWVVIPIDKWSTRVMLTDI
ncbi:MAG: hypothetical protein AAF462_11350, partial [Thermodesulfobacteriota bacterium]